MKKITTALLFAILFFAGCRSASTVIFGKKTPIEKYEEKLQDTGLEKTPEGRQWLAASDLALQHPQTIQIPYHHIGNFGADKPRALGLAFTVTHGEQLFFTVNKKSAPEFSLYVELHRQNSDGGTTLLHAADTTATDFSYTVTETGSYVLKLQPPLFNAGHYHLSISMGPSLGFPVAGSKATVGSFWGADRDGGKRSHEGIDIFALKGTPAVAAADGHIVSVREGGIGGKTVWLRPADAAYTLYYAHLDEQLVQEGQAVKKGDTIGLVGNTGNAKHTPPHLHFGIYGYGGAVDPYPFVNRTVRRAPAVNDKKLNEYVRLTKDYKEGAVLIRKNTLVIPVAFNNKGYIGELPDGSLLQLSGNAVQASLESLKKVKTIASANLYKAPAAPLTIATLPTGSAVSVLGYFNEYVFVRSGDKEGWIMEAAQKS